MIPIMDTEYAPSDYQHRIIITRGIFTVLPCIFSHLKSGHVIRCLNQCITHHSQWQPLMDAQLPLTVRAMTWAGSKGKLLSS